MNESSVLERLRSLVTKELPLPGGGQTAQRHWRLMQVGCEDLSLARLAEAHWDALAILAEAGRSPVPGAIYGVWAAEIPNQALQLQQSSQGLLLSGIKRFCSGAGLIDQALVTAGTSDHRLVEVDLRKFPQQLQFDDSDWKTQAFLETKTSTVTFESVPCAAEDIIGGSHWYLDRPGFWHGACGPAACWAGGALALVEYCKAQARDDAHTRAHLGAMAAAAWALRSLLRTAGEEIDESPLDIVKARIRARIVRHLVEQAATDILRRLARAYGPHPIAMNEEVSRRYQELDLYLRQSHAERDLEALGSDIKLHPGFE